MPVSSTMNHHLAVPCFSTDKIKSSEDPRQLTEVLSLSVMVQIRGNIPLAAPSDGSTENNAAVKLLAEVISLCGT